MTYEEFKKVYDILLEKEFVKRNKPLWDMDIYNMIEQLNKECEV